MWWRQSQLSCIFLSILLGSSLSWAQSLAFSRNARTFEATQSSLFVKSLGHACLTLFTTPDGMPCNPANIPMQKNPKLGIELLLSNGSSSLSNVRRLLDGEVTQELTDKLFSDGQIIQIEANSIIAFQSANFNASYTPFSVKGFTVVRNEANPDVELSAIEEKGFHFQYGHEIYRNFFVGAQIRFVERKLIRQQFKLVVLGTPAGNDLLEPKVQKATYFEPSMTWVLGEKYKPRVSAMIMNLGTLSKEFEEFEIPVDYQVGFGIAPPVEWGSLELFLEYKSLSFTETDLKKFRFGGAYRFGAMNLAAGLDSNGISGGIFYALEQINAGVMFSTTKLINSSEEFFTQTVYVQLGWRI